jgi:hypothetical protein
LLITMAVGCISFGGARAAMIDPATDDPHREWCYLAKSTTVIGVPFQPDVTQVTFDGAVFTGSAEMCFFFGKPLRPLLARQKTFLDGWIPVVVYQWQEASIGYDIEIFAAPLEDGDVSNTVNFVRARMRNTGGVRAKGTLAAAMRHSGQVYRFGQAAFRPDESYEMTDGAVFRGDAMVYTFPAGGVYEAVPGAAYCEPFRGGKYHVTPRSEVCLVRYEPELAPGQTAAFVFKMPRVPVPRKDAPVVEKIQAADYDRYRAWTEDYWRGVLQRGAVLEIPERRVHNAQRASLVHLMLATRQRADRKFQTSGLPYPNFFMIDFVDMRMAYDALGQPALARQSFPEILARQQADGLFCDTSLSHGRRLWSSHGHMVHSLASHYLMTRDKEHARSVYPQLRRAVEWIRQARAENRHGLMPPTWPYDAEMIQGHYTSHNLWCLLGLRSAVRMARELGPTADADSWRKLHDEYEAAFFRALEATAGENGYVPTGLYPFETGKQYPAYGYNCDWENILLAHPTEVLDPWDKRVTATLRKVRDGFAEGIMTYRHGMHLHQYVTTNVVQQHLARGEQKQTLADLYHVLLHCGSTHEGFENLVRPWQDRMVEPGCPPPHAWAAAKIALTIRNCLLHEFGGRAGLDEDARDLYLFPVVSPAWARPGRRIVIRNAPTEMGIISACMAFTASGAQLAIESRFHHPPKCIVIRIPYFVTLESFSADARESRLDGRTVVLSPDAKHVNLVWREDAKADRETLQELLLAYRRESSFSGGPVPIPGGSGFLLDSEKPARSSPLCFDVVLGAFRQEYARRCAEFCKAGGKLTVVEAPSMLTAEERRTAFTAAYGEPGK